MTKAIVVFCTVSSPIEGKRLALALLEAKLAACVSLVPQVSSHYWWKGKIESGREVLLVIKTQRRLFRALSKRLHALHSYTVPEVLALPVLLGGKRYLDWLAGSVRRNGQ
jgi:periplasmic divalent cation tolerance protein